jgi:hypothetical protein
LRTPRVVLTLQMFGGQLLERSLLRRSPSISISGGPSLNDDAQGRSSAKSNGLKLSLYPLPSTYGIAKRLASQGVSRLKLNLKKFFSMPFFFLYSISLYGICAYLRDTKHSITSSHFEIFA